MEEWFFPEDHGCKHRAKRPHVEGVVVLLEVDKKFRAFEVSRCHSNVVLRALVVELRKTPIDKPKLETINVIEVGSRVARGNSSYLPLLMINHNIVRLNVPMHNTFAMAKIQRLQQLKDVIPDVVVYKLRV